MRVKQADDSPIRVYVVFGNPRALFGGPGRIVFYSVGNEEPDGYAASSHVSGRIHIGAILVIGCSATPPTAPDAAPIDPGTLPAAGTPVKGRIAGAGGHQGAGAVSLTVVDGQALLEFGADFGVSGVPGPFVYVNTTNNANTGTPLRVAALQRNSGAQRYAFQVPVGVSYTWVLVWCDPFNTPVAEASIAATP